MARTKKITPIKEIKETKIETPIKETKIEETKIEETEIISMEELVKQEEQEEAKFLKKQEQNKRVWYSCETKGHFGMMIPQRYLTREGIVEKLVCPVCGKPLLHNVREIRAAANK